MGYLIEFRFSGSAKAAIRELKYNITKHFGVTTQRMVPHITLVGSLNTNNERRLLNEIKDVCKKYRLVEFYLSGVDTFDRDTIFVNINPSNELKKLRRELAGRLKKFCELGEYDYGRDYNFHATLVLKDIEKKYDRIMEYVNTWQIPNMRQYVLRVTVVKRNLILAEYDLIQGKMLNRSESLDRDIFRKTIEKLHGQITPGEIVFNNIPNKDVFVISDTHFDHENIIKKFVHRPFTSTREMNDALVRNWNDAVKDDTVIYFLGDMSFGKGRRPLDYWLNKLNGNVFFIRGNHDSDIITGATIIHDRYGIKYKGYEFLLMHDPYRPYGYDGWIIHGDIHNNNLREYPFINQDSKMINVCPEVVDYTPVSLDKVIFLIESGKNHETISS